MTIQNMLRGFLAFLSISFIGCGSSMYTNKDYTFKPMDSVAVAIIPIGSQPNVTDTAFAKAFRDSLGYKRMLSPARARQILLANPTLLRSVNTIIENDYTPAQLESNPSLSTFLTEGESRSLVSAFDASDVLLVPVQFDVSSSMGHTFGFYKFRLYDLRNGSLIYEKSMDLNVNIPGEAGERHLSIVLIAFAAGDFHEYYLNKVKK